MTNAEYTKVLGKVLGRPTVLPLPAPAARIMLGEVADALLLASQRMQPAKLKTTGYTFRYPQLEGALRHLLGK
jgi:NAD dependent epimerase/dehydratase family enzyme